MRLCNVQTRRIERHKVAGAILPPLPTAVAANSWRFMEDVGFFQSRPVCCLTSAVLEEIAPRGRNERRFNVLPTLKDGGLLREIGACDSSRASELAPAGGICLLRWETFGQELSEGQTSVSWLRGTGCQRSSFLPNSCKSEQNRGAATLLFKQPGEALHDERKSARTRV